MQIRPGEPGYTAPVVVRPPDDRPLCMAVKHEGWWKCKLSVNQTRVWEEGMAINVYFDGKGGVYAATKRRANQHGQSNMRHDKINEVQTLEQARQFVQHHFDVLIANYDQWIVGQGHPGMGDGEE